MIKIFLRVPLLLLVDEDVLFVSLVLTADSKYIEKKSRDEHLYVRIICFQGNKKKENPQ
jgi:hypothetical protein